QEWLRTLDRAADQLEVSDRARSVAGDLFLSDPPAEDRSKPAAVAASLYAATLVVGDERPQTAVANAVGVSRIAVQNRWKERLESAGFEAPEW
ncbi:MAG: transcription initiation factor IIB family protein, partial [Halobacteriales archaeon]|nr:transcription initiation factor IIB family protein [Halobacteriales archaeon]